MKIQKIVTTLVKVVFELSLNEDVGHFPLVWGEY
jgi:hypothetical protein